MLRFAIAGSLVALLIGCGSGTLTRERAAELIAPQVVSSILLNVSMSYWTDDPTVESLRSAGALTVDGSDVRFSNVALPFVGKQQPGRNFVPLTLATARFKRITGLKVVDAGTHSYAAEFEWEFVPNAVGQKLDGKTYRAINLTTQVMVFPRSLPGVAQCATYDDGWRCTLTDWVRELQLGFPPG